MVTRVLATEISYTLFRFVHKGCTEFQLAVNSYLAKKKKKKLIRDFGEN